MQAIAGGAAAAGGAGGDRECFLAGGIQSGAGAAGRKACGNLEREKADGCTACRLGGERAGIHPTAV